ncbi:hypothetical protein BH11PLA2_BH11PLA2_30500 [soil metagenome]
MDAKLFDLARSDQRYAYEAYEFVCEAVTYTQERLGKIVESEFVPEEDDEPAADPHVSGEELLRGGCELAVRDFGLMAPLVFRRWGMFTTDDFGEIVFRLIESDKLSRSDSDDPQDFHEVFDLHQALSEGYETAMGDAPATKADR